MSMPMVVVGLDDTLACSQRTQEAPTQVHSLNRLNLTFRSRSRLISYSAYLKKSSLRVVLLIRDVSYWVLFFVIWSISYYR